MKGKLYVIQERAGGITRNIYYTSYKAAWKHMQGFSGDNVVSSPAVWTMLEVSPSHVANRWHKERALREILYFKAKEKGDVS